MAILKTGSIPRYSPAAGILMSASSFTDGDIKTFYGPGQRPDSMGLGQLDNYSLYGHIDVIGGDTIHDDRFVMMNQEWAVGHFTIPPPVVVLPVLKDYSPPVGWPSPGHLIRPPQFVMITKNYSIINNWIRFADSTFNFVSPREQWPPFSPTEYTSMVSEASRLDSVFQSISTSIGNIRSGRTFVSSGDWVSPDSTYPFGLVPWSKRTTKQVFLDPATFWSPEQVDPVQSVFYRYSKANAINVLPIPASSEFFGADFLHIFLGFPAICDHYGCYVGPKTFNMHIIVAADPNYTYDDTGRAPPNQIFIPSVDLSGLSNFNSYTVMVFQSALGSGSFPIVLVADPVNGGNADLLFSIELSSSQFLDDLVSSYGSEVDIRRSGVTTDATAESLMTLIASHFGFDPNTGKDL